MRVYLRKFPEGDTIALFPDEPQERGLIESYMVVGQHGSACPELIEELEVATVDECAKLLADLKACGYEYLDIQEI